MLVNVKLKIINFGKSTLVTDPLKNDKEPWYKQYERFNTDLLFLAYNIHNNHRSYQSIAWDVYSIGYNIDFLLNIWKAIVT